LFCYCQRIIDLNPEIPDGALDFRVAERELNGSKIASAPIPFRNQIDLAQFSG
jgi:hypothetical protein